MVLIKYIDGDQEEVNTVDNHKGYFGHYHYEPDTQTYVIHTAEDSADCMRVSKDYVKSIRPIIGDD